MVLDVQELLSLEDATAIQDGNVLDLGGYYDRFAVQTWDDNGSGATFSVDLKGSMDNVHWYTLASVGRNQVSVRYSGADNAYLARYIRASVTGVDAGPTPLINARIAGIASSGLTGFSGTFS